MTYTGNLPCKVCIFLEDGKVYAHFKSNCLVAKHSGNYGRMHIMDFVGNYSKREIKVMFPFARFVEFKDLERHDFARQKIVELESEK